MRHAIIAKSKEINWFFTQLLTFPSSLDFVFITSLSELNNYDDINKLFFVHWSDLVPDEILNKYECICFHPTDLPYGRGGSPYQHMILSGAEVTVMTAFRMTDKLDAGPIYLAETMSLQGNLNEILQRGYAIIADMIRAILRYDPRPYPQEGNVVEFKRRKPEDSNLMEYASATYPRDIYNFIRMLDDDTYPRAFIEIDGNRFEFSNVVYKEDIDEVRGEFRLWSR